MTMINLSGLSVSVFLNGIGVKFAPPTDPELAFKVFLEKKYIQQKNPLTLEGKEWIPASDWFNPTGTAFWDGRVTTKGPEPSVNIQANTANNALIADGTTYKLIVGIYRVVKFPGGGGENQYLGISQEITFVAPKLYSTPPQTAPVNYSPKVTANCDGTLIISMENKAQTLNYDIMISGPGFDGMEKVANVPVNPNGPTVYHYPEVIPTTGQVGVTVIPFIGPDTTGPIPTSTVLLNGNTDPALPVFDRGLTYQYGAQATGTPCIPPSTEVPTDGKPGKGNSGGKGKP